MEPLLSVIHVTLTIYKVKMKVINYFKVHHPFNKGNNSHWYRRLKSLTLSKVIPQSLLIKQTALSVYKMHTNIPVLVVYIHLPLGDLSQHILPLS